MENNFFEQIKNRTLLLDGAMGTMLQANGLKVGECPERLNVTKPEFIQKIHKDYFDAGSDIILANTFGANRTKLEEFALEDKVEQINKAGVRLARDVVGKDAFVACSIAPTGKIVEPVGEMSFQKAFDVYKEQITVCIEAGADIVVLESFTDIKELRAALIAANEVKKGHPVFAFMSFQEDFRTVMGTSPEAAAVTLSSLGADFIGANCSLGPDLLLKIIKRMKKFSKKPLVVQPNAGMPELKNNITTFPATPDFMADYVAKFVEQGVKIIGGCCGTTPKHIEMMAQAAKKVKPVKFERSEKGTFVSNRTDAIIIGGGNPTRIIGERINPTGKQYLIDELKVGKVSKVKEMATDQTDDGANILDINVGAAGVDQRAMMEKVIMSVQGTITVPLMIDSQDVNVIEAGLKAADGKVIINSVSGEKEKLDSILPLAKKYGAAVLGLTLNEKGIPRTAKKRVEIAEKIIKAAEKHGIDTADIIIDCLALAASAEQEQVAETLEAIRIIKSRFNVSTVLGVSNVSFGLPERSLLNASFLSMAIEAGLDSAIVNPSDMLVLQALYASDLLAGKDKNSANYLNRIEKHKCKVVLSDSDVSVKTGRSSSRKENKGVKEKLYNSVMQGDKDNITCLLETALTENIKPIDISNEILIPALKEVGDFFEKKVYFLPQMILSAETMQVAFDRLKKEFDSQDAISKGKVLMATVKGDVHDIGKNIVITLIKNYGYDVIDLGKSVPAEVIIDHAIKENADIIGMSALMTTTMIEMEKVINLLNKENINIKTIVGGAVVTERYANDIGASAYGKDALDAVRKVDSLIESCKVGAVVA